MFLVGVDENGLGPQLGPLVATAVTLEVDRYDASRLRGIGARAGVHDSKQVGGFGHMAWTESVVLALMHALHGVTPVDCDALWSMLSLDPIDVLQRPCPSNVRAQCWSQVLALPAFGGDAAEGARMLSRLSRAGVHVTHARSALACAGVLNARFAQGETRVGIDLALFERLLIDARERSASDVTAICGMVGGIRDYRAYFHAFDASCVSDRKSNKLSRAYHVQGLGDVSFVIDADAKHLPVGLASMIGKYVRELAMERQNRFYVQHDADLAPGSGYHDPVTTRFVQASASLRRRLSIVDACFLR